MITCMDARIEPLSMLGLQPGDAHVIRNAGALVTDDVRRSLDLSRALGTEEVALILHTDCGARAGDLDDAVRGEVAGLGSRARGYVYDVETRELREVT